MAADPPSPPPANGFVRVMRKVYHPLHFYKGYNFVLFFVFAGALVGFSLSRMPFLDFDRTFCKGRGLPGECFYYGRSYWRVGMLMHLATILPAGLLVVLQFVPVIRHKLIIFHRVNGYVVILLSFASTAGVFMVARVAFGGLLHSQTIIGVLSIMFLSAKVLAYINIKRLQIDQHRAWMLRAWGWVGSIITVRIIMIISAIIVTDQAEQWVATPCLIVDHSFKNNQTKVLQSYPECGRFYSGEFPDAHAAVRLGFDSNIVGAESVLGVSFGMATWLALAIHVLGVELYLRLTPRESERLRTVSYERQLAAGYKNPGSAGLTAESLGDAEPWVPRVLPDEHGVDHGADSRYRTEDAEAPQMRGLK